jgi:hypothetical protein
MSKWRNETQTDIRDIKRQSEVHRSRCFLSGEYFFAIARMTVTVMATPSNDISTILAVPGIKYPSTEQAINIMQEVKRGLFEKMSML